MIRWILLLCVVFTLPVHAAAFRLETDGLPLLKAWCDGLLAHQVKEGEDRGGFLCPAVKQVPGRSADAVYPLLALHRMTGEEKYRQAAIDVFDWSERRISQPDGSWVNEVNVPWKGITAFSLIALGEALRHDGNALPPAERERWKERLRKGADFLFGYMTFETGDLNYPLSSSASLALAAKVLGDDQYLPRARELAHFGLRHLTANGLLWGEGERGPNDISPRGLRAIDVLYNVEESLPNLALYAELTGDKEIEDFVVAGFREHLNFLLPDGAWDAGWSGRQYKWAWWGSRTCDGAAHGLQLLRARDPRFAEAAARNLQLLKSCTHDGLLYGGPGLHARGLPASIQHTIFHAKSLAAALDAGTAGSSAAVLPSDTADGLREWSEAGVVQFARGGWRGSVTVNDIPQTKKRGGQPSGGALSLLWHEKTGPLCVASMNDYVRYEGLNMQTPATAADQHCLTPRLELHADGKIFSSIYDGASTMKSSDRDGQIEIRIRGTLRDKTGASNATPAAFEMVYRITKSAFTITARAEGDGVVLEVPLVSPAVEPARQLADGSLEIVKPGIALLATGSGAKPTLDDTTRVFNFVPGMEAVPLRLALRQSEEVTLKLTIQSHE